MKTISWRIWATLITFLVTWIMVGNIKTGIKVGVADTTIKFFTYYIHDFAWLKFNVIKNTEAVAEPSVEENDPE
jgi:uncharacterized membrane protein